MNKGYYTCILNLYRNNACNSVFLKERFSSKKKIVDAARLKWRTFFASYDRAEVTVKHYNENDYNDSNEVIHI